MAVNLVALGAFLDGKADEQVMFLRRLLQTPTDNPPGDCAAHADMLANLLRDLEFSVDRHWVPDTEAHGAGMISVCNLIVRHRFNGAGADAGPTLALNAHGDVVPPGDGWHYDPYGGAIDAGWIYGRGAAVSKSDMATYTYALLACRDLMPDLNGTVELHFTYDEEIGGIIGPKWLLDNGLTRPDYAICPGFCYDVVIAHNGCLHLEVTITGKSAHAALPETGHDALEAATAIMSRLYADRAQLSATVSEVDGIGSPSLVIGRIDGGINTNVVPDRIHLRLDRRMIPEEDPGTVEQELRQTIADVTKGFPGISSTCRRILLATPLRPVAGTDKLAGIVQDIAHDVMGEDIAKKGVPLYADARHYAAAGIPTVMYGAGPRTLEDANGHRADERIRLTELRQATEVIARTIAHLLQ